MFATYLSFISHPHNLSKKLLIKKAVAAKSPWNYVWYWYVTAGINSEATSPKNAYQTRSILKSFRTVSMFSFCYRNCNMSYFHLFKHILGSTNLFVFFSFVILSDWYIFLLRMTFFNRIVEEEKNMAQC